MGNSTFLQIPNDISDPVVLRRVLTSMVETIDTLKGNRGDDAAATESQLVSTASSIDELAKDLNSLDNNFLRKDGKNVATSPLSYDGKKNLSGFNFADVRSVEDKMKLLEKTLGKKFIKKGDEVAPTLLAGNTDPAAISSKVDEIIQKLILVGVLS